MERRITESCDNHDREQAEMKSDRESAPTLCSLFTVDYPKGDRGGNEICVRVTQTGQPLDLHRFWDGVITSSQNLMRLRNDVTALRNRQEFQRSQLTELASTDFESWAKESFEIATKIAYQNGRLIGAPKAGNRDCTTLTTAPVLPMGYVINASRIADRRIILTGYRLAGLLMRVPRKPGLKKTLTAQLCETDRRLSLDPGGAEHRDGSFSLVV